MGNRCFFKFKNGLVVDQTLIVTEGKWGHWVHQWGSSEESKL